MKSFQGLVQKPVIGTAGRPYVFPARFRSMETLSMIPSDT